MIIKVVKVEKLLDVLINNKLSKEPYIESINAKVWLSLGQ